MQKLLLTFSILFLPLSLSADSSGKQKSDDTNETPIYKIDNVSEKKHKVKQEPDAFWTYKTVGDLELKLHVFLPEGYAEAEKLPVFVIFHGGSWRAGEASWHYADCEYWASRGMVAVSVDDRLKDRDSVKVPLECVKDAKSVVRYLRKNASELKVDPDKIVVAGGSAGGQLAAAVSSISTPETNDDAYDLSISPDANVSVLFNPYFKCAESLSPPYHVEKGDPATITFLGDKDPAITVESLKDYHDSLLANEIDSEYYVGVGGKHGLCNGRNPKNPYFYWGLQLTDNFLVKHGILETNHEVNVPEGVKRLADGVDYKTYK